METGAIIALGSLLVAFIALLVGARRDTRGEAASQAQVHAKLDSIAGGVDDIRVEQRAMRERLDGYAVYYEKNPAMQEYLVAQNRHSDPVRNKMECEVSSREDVARNYRAILNKLNEKPSRKKYQPLSGTTR